MVIPRQLGTREMLTELRKWTTAKAAKAAPGVILALFALLLALGLGYFVAQGHWRYVGALMGAVLLLCWPVEVALGGYALLIPLEFLTAFGPGRERTTVAWYVGAVAVAVVLTIGLLRGSIVKPSRTAVLLSLLVFWAAVSTAWAHNTQHALLRLRTALPLLGLYLVIVCVRFTKRELSRIVWATIAGGCAASAYAAYLFAHGGLERATLSAGNNDADPNFFAASLLVPLALAFGEFLGRRNKSRKILAVGCAGLVALGIFLSMSRGAALALVTILAVFFYRLRLNWRLLIPVSAVAVVLLVVPSVFFTRIQQASATRGAGRLDIWQVGLAELQDNGLLGVGLDNFADIYGRYSGRGKVYKGPARNAHNIYLKIAVETGVLGIFLLLSAIVAQLGAFRRMRVGEGKLPPPEWVAFEAGLYSMLVAAFFLDLIWFKSFWWAFVLMGIAINAWRPQAQQHERYQLQASPAFFPTAVRFR
jgi:O-antigen ligase